MKMSQAFLVCLSLLGATHLAVCQVKQPAVPVIPGYLDPNTGKFTTQVASAGAAQDNAQVNPAAVTGTSIFFREEFQIAILNYDQPANSNVVCSVSIGSNDANYYFNDSAAVTATAGGGGWTCDIPILTLWTLKTPTTDSITATITITIAPQGVNNSTYTGGNYRSSGQSLTLAQPSNGQTVVSNVTFQL